MSEYFNEILKGDQGALKRALYKSMGFSDEALRKPIIAIVNSYTNATPGHFNLNDVANSVERGIEAAGGTAMTFGTIAPCDGIAEGHDGMRYILPSRDLITSSIECMVRAHRFDGIVLLGSCDKIVPGMIMSAARLNIPAIFLNGGPMLAAKYKGKDYDGNIVTEAIGWKTRGEITEEEFKKIEDIAEPCVGSCAMLGTANTMGIMAEALGMMLPGCATIPAIQSKRLTAGYETGRAIVDLVFNKVKARDIITEKSIRNAIKTLMGIGGSTNAIMHLQAIHREAGLGDLPLSVFNELSEQIPQIASVYPASPFTMADFNDAGGVLAVMKELQKYLDGDCLTVNGKTIDENLVSVQKSNNDKIIKTVEEPFSQDGGVAILTGNLSPLGSVVKPAAIPKDLLEYKGTAKVYHSEQEAIDSILSGEVKPFTAVVLAYEGPKGGPGMPEMYRPMKCLEGMNLSNSCAIVTDGRFSGSNRGLFVGHISPEAYECGTIALVQDGDVIEINIAKRKIELLVDEQELEKRRAKWVQPQKELKDGYLSTYKNNAVSAAQGAVVV